jgi:hypothetical protein
MNDEEIRIKCLEVSAMSPDTHSQKSLLDNAKELYGWIVDGGPAEEIA